MCDISMFSTYACKFRQNAISDTSKLNPGIFLTHLAAIDLTDDSTRREEHLSAEEMEMEAGLSGWPVCPQAKHFATLSLDHYNSTKKTVYLQYSLPSFFLFLTQYISWLPNIFRIMQHKFEMARVLLSNCFSEADGTTFSHVNFTATPQQSSGWPVCPQASMC